MYVCMYFKQGFYRPITVLESLKRFLHIIARKKTNQQYEKISLCINQCWNSLNLINVQFLTNALGNYVWLTEKWSGLMKLKLFWRRSKTNSLSWRRKLRLEGENKEYNGTLPPSSCLEDLHISRSLYWVILNCQISTFLCFRRFFYGANRTLIFTGQSPSSNLLKRFLYIIARKKASQQYEKISLCINQCWNAPNLINVQFLTNAFGNYVWLTEK